MVFFRYIRPIALTCLITSSASILSACVPLLVGGAVATTAVVVSDRRSGSSQLEDEKIKVLANNRLSNLGEQSHIVAQVYNQWLLLAGEAPNESTRQNAIHMAKQIRGVKKVISDIVLAPPAGLANRSNDSWITSKVRSMLITEAGVPSRTISVMTERGVVYLMGLVTQAEGDKTAQVAARVTGVQRVMKAFQYIKNPPLSNSNPSNAPVIYSPRTSGGENLNAGSSSVTTPLK